jgi:hypothetical protein
MTKNKNVFSLSYTAPTGQAPQPILTDRQLSGFDPKDAIMSPQSACFDFDLKS